MQYCVLLFSHLRVTTCLRHLRGTVSLRVLERQSAPRLFVGWLLLTVAAET